MKTPKIISITDEQLSQVEWIILTQRGLGFFKGKLIYYKGLATIINLRRSVQLYEEILCESENADCVEFSSESGAVVRWMKLINLELSRSKKATACEMHALLPTLPTNIQAN